MTFNGVNESFLHSKSHLHHYTCGSPIYKYILSYYRLPTKSSTDLRSLYIFAVWRDTATLYGNVLEGI